MTTTCDDLPRIIAKHGKWCRGEDDGERASLNGANLNGANLDGANLDGASLDGANLYRASLNGANLNGANLDGANLDGASLDGANLYRASLDGASLDGASLNGANLYRANLYRASLDGANLYRANLNGANLDGASWGDGITSKMPVIQVLGLGYPILLLDGHAKIGCKMKSLAEWASMDFAGADEHGITAAKIWKADRDWLLAMASANGRVW